MSLDAVLNRIDEDLQTSIDRLMELLRIPSISTISWSTSSRVPAIADVSGASTAAGKRRAARTNARGSSSTPSRRSGPPEQGPGG